MLRTIVWAVAVGCSATACNCSPKTIAPPGELRLSPSPLDFGMACVKPSSPALTVRPVTRTLELQNAGLVALDLEALELDGGAGFSVAGDWPRQLGSSETKPLRVSFLPEKAGKATATLSFTDATGAVSSVELTGQGAVTAPEPVVSLKCPGGRSGPTAELCWDTANMQPRPNPLMWLPDTLIGSSSELQLRVGNLGCADLEVSGTAVDGGAFSVSSGGGAFTVAGLGAADAGEQVVTVRFAPQTAGAQNGLLKLATNVPGMGDVNVRLLGSGVQPSLQLCTTGSVAQCSTPTIPATCDFTAPTPCAGTFVVRNAGASPLVVDSARLQNATGRFSVSGLPGTFPVTLAPSGMGGDSFSFAVAFTGGATFASDVLEVSSNGGKLRAAVTGGQPPQLELNPGALDFGARATGYDGTLSFELKNVGAGPLTVHSVSFPGGAQWPSAMTPVFTVTPPAAESVVMPGASTMVPVRFVDPPNGGDFAVELVVHTDDPRYEASGGKLFTVSGKTPCNPIPVAVVTGPSSGAAGASVTLDASGSYDVKPDGSGSCVPGLKGPVTRWEWNLLSVPANGSAAQLVSNAGMATLSLGACAPCSYVVRLAVYDDTPGGGRKSNFTDFTVTAQ